MPRHIDPQAWGVEPGFVDAFGQERPAPPETVAAVLEAMGATPDGPPPAPDAGASGPGPSRCPLPTNAPTWGWAAQLYAARSHESWGIGDLGDLGRLARWSAGKG